MPTHVANIPVVATWSWPTALWSLFLVVLVLAVMTYKLHLLRMQIKNLAEMLPNLGSEFIRREILEVRKDLDTTIARLRICEEKVGFNGIDDP